jgi:hypothetical protein
MVMPVRWPGADRHDTAPPSPPRNARRAETRAPPRPRATSHSLLTAWAPPAPATVTIVLRDHGSGPPAQAPGDPATRGGRGLPPYRPERHPRERLGPAVNAPPAWVLPPRIDA